MKKFIFTIMFLAFILSIFSISILIMQWLWNSFCSVFNMNPITYWQMFALYLFVASLGALFKNFKK